MEKEAVKVIEVNIGGEVKKVEVHKPTPKIEAQANMESSKVFAKLIKAKNEDGTAAFILRSQLNDFLAQNGVYTEQDIEDLTIFSERIKELEETLSKGGKKKSEGKAAAIELKKLRLALYSLLIKQAEYDKNTVEHYADNARMDYLITKCITFEGGGQIFKNVEDYESDDLMQKAFAEPIRELASIVSSYDPDFEKNLPENKFLIKYGFCNEDLRFINKDGKFVDEHGNLVDQDGNRIDSEPKKESVGEFLDDEDVVTIEVDPVAAEENKVA
jgi:hypothetical protein